MFRPFKLSFLCAVFSIAGLPNLSSSYAQENPIQEGDEIEIPFGWKTGDKNRFSVERIDFNSGNARPTKKTVFTVEVVSRDQESVIAKCELEILTDSEQQKLIDSTPIAKQMLELYRDLEIRVRIGTDGILEAIENEEDVKKIFNNTFSNVRDAIDSTDLDNDKQKLLERMISETVNFPRFQNELLAPLNLMLMTTATSHSKSTPYEQASTTELLFARGVPTIEKYQVEKFDSENKIVTVLYSEIASGDEAAKLVKDSVEAFIKRMNPNSKETVVVEGVVSEAKAKFEVNYQTGWPMKVEWRTRINDLKTGSLQDKQSIVIEKIESNVEPSAK